MNHLNEKNWSRKAVVYQIYPRSFKDTTGNGIGDLRGIIEKLDYLNDGTENSLGIGAIWINPIYKSPMKDFGYDISDYYDIDPLFGDLKTFDNLIEEAHRRGIKVLMDFVPNHTSSEHAWFKESRSSKDNPKRNWYIWKDPKPDGSPPNNWLSVFGGVAWTLDKTTGQYYLHSFLPNQPDLNWHNQEVRNEMANILRFWLDRGIGGFRTDAVYHLIKDAQFRDDPLNQNYIEGKDDPYNKLIHKYSQGQPELIETTNTLCNVIGEHENTFLVSEAYLGIPEMAKLYKACENNLHSPFNFNLMTLLWDAKKYKEFIDDFETSLRPQDWPNYVLGNHDRSRVASRLGRQRTRIAAMLLFTLRGMPFIYYGDEIGMKDVEIPENKICDPWGKRVPHLDVGRDPERTPMQWSAEKYAGFSNPPVGGEPWLPVADDYKEYNVETEKSDPRSMYNLYKELIHHRTNSCALLHGDYVPFDCKSNQIFSYKRKCDKEELLIALNFSDKEQSFSLDIPAPGRAGGKLLCNTLRDKPRSEKIDFKNISLRPYEGILIKLK